MNYHPLRPQSPQLKLSTKICTELISVISSNIINVKEIKNGKLRWELFPSIKSHIISSNDPTAPINLYLTLNSENNDRHKKEGMSMFPVIKSSQQEESKQVTSKWSPDVRTSRRYMNRKPCPHTPEESANSTPNKKMIQGSPTVFQGEKTGLTACTIRFLSTIRPGFPHTHLIPWRRTWRRGSL